MPTLQHIHPMLVHFPIVLAILLVGIDAVALWRDVPLDGRGTYAGFSLTTALLAGISALVAMGFGDLAMEYAVAHGVPEGLMETHEGLGTTTALLLGAWAVLRLFAWWRRMPLGGGRKVGVVAVDAALVLLILVTAWYGGSLVFEHGVNVVTGG